MKRFSCIALLLAASSAALFAQRKIDDAALKNAAKTPEEWLSYGFTPGETRYVPIDQINTAFDLMHSGASIRSVVTFP